MKKFVRFLVLIVLVGFTSAYTTKAQSSLVNDTVTMGAAYTNEVYYSMANGSVATTPRDQWDIAFRTNIMSSSIIINDGTGVILFTYPNSDTSGWANMDTTGLSSWTPMFNDPDDWENGAFSRNALGHPDYGWGIYNSTTHNLKGDSLFVVKLRNESYRKIWIVRKYSALSTYIFKFAYLDGSDEHEITLDLSGYSTKDFVGYNLAMNVVVDFQPPKADWDLLFTKYMSIQPTGDPYIVTGVLSNSDIGVGRYEGVAPDFSDWGTGGFSDWRSQIGYNWKTYDFGANAYVCDPELKFFVRDQIGDVYELRFLEFLGGSPTGMGKTILGKNRVSLVGIGQPTENQSYVNVYPNPVSDQINISLKDQISSNVKVSINDILGQNVYNNILNNIQGNMNFSVPVNNWIPGLYIVNITSGNYSTTQKLIVK